MISLFMFTMRYYIESPCTSLSNQEVSSTWTCVPEIRSSSLNLTSQGSRISISRELCHHLSNSYTCVIIPSRYLYEQARRSTIMMLRSQLSTWNHCYDVRFHYDMKKLKLSFDQQTHQFNLCHSDRSTLHISPVTQDINYNICLYRIVGNEEVKFLTYSSHLHYLKIKLFYVNRYFWLLCLVKTLNFAPYR